MEVTLELGRQKAEGPRPAQLHTKFKAGLHYMRQCLQKQTNLNKKKFWDKGKEAQGRKPSETQRDVRGKTENGMSQMETETKWFAWGMEVTEGCRQNGSPGPSVEHGYNGPLGFAFGI